MAAFDPEYVKLLTVPDIDPAKLPVRSWHFYTLSLSAVVHCVVLWIRAKTIGEDERANAERRALFVGLWPSMFWLMGDALRRREQRQGLAGLRRRLSHR